MNPIHQARALWHSMGEPEIDWDELLEFFLAEGAVVSTPEVFLLARPTLVALPDIAQNAFSPLQFHGPPDCWNVWLAAGRLDLLLELAHAHPLPWVSFSRRGSDRLRRYRLSTLVARHALAQTPQDGRPATAAAATAAGFNERG